MIAVSSYLVQVDHENRYLGQIELTDDIEVLPISGTIRAAPINSPAREGDRIFFQWNALLEPVFIDGCLLLDPEFVYRIGDVMMDDWLWVEITEQQDGWCNGKVFASTNDLYLYGDAVLFERIRAHRIETRGINTLNPHGTPIFAIRSVDILMV